MRFQGAGKESPEIGDPPEGHMQEGDSIIEPHIQYHRDPVIDAQVTGAYRGLNDQISLRRARPGTKLDFSE